MTAAARQLGPPIPVAALLGSIGGEGVVDVLVGEVEGEGPISVGLDELDRPVGELLGDVRLA